MEKVYTVKVEEGREDGVKPSAGPVYRSIYASEGLVALPPGINSPWQFFRDAAKKMPDGKMLGRRLLPDSKAGPYVWMTYQQGYDSALRIGSAIRSRNVNLGDCCGIYGSNCPEWIIAMEGCSSQGITYVPLYDTLASVPEGLLGSVATRGDDDRAFAAIYCLNHRCYELECPLSKPLEMLLSLTEETREVRSLYARDIIYIAISQKHLLCAFVYTLYTFNAYELHINFTCTCTYIALLGSAIFSSCFNKINPTNF